MTLKTGLKRVLWPWPLNIWSLKIKRDHLLIGCNPCTKFGIDQVKGSKDIERRTHLACEWFDLDLWTCDLKINRDHLLIEGNPCTKFGINQVKGSKDIERTTQWAEKSGLTLTFEQVTWKSMGIIYTLRATPAPCLVLIKWRGQKILSREHSGLVRVVWFWPLNIWPENQ